MYKAQNARKKYYDFQGMLTSSIYHIFEFIRIVFSDFCYELNSDKFILTNYKKIMFSESEYAMLNFINYVSKINGINQNRKPEIWIAKERASVKQILFRRIKYIFQAIH